MKDVLEVPGQAATGLQGSPPGALQEAVCLCVLTEELQFLVAMAEAAPLDLTHVVEGLSGGQCMFHVEPNVKEPSPHVVVQA